MKKLTSGTVYTAEDFLNHVVEPKLRKGLTFNIDKVYDKSNNYTVDVWVSDKRGETLDVREGLKTETEIIEAIDYLGRKYE